MYNDSKLYFDHYSHILLLFLYFLVDNRSQKLAIRIFPCSLYQIQQHSCTFQDHHNPDQSVFLIFLVQNRIYPYTVLFFSREVCNHYSAFHHEEKNEQILFIM